LKRAVFPLLIFFFIVAALVYRLASCSSNVDKNSAASYTGASPSAAATAGASASAAPPSAKPAASPEVNYTDADINNIFKKDG
jgi:hypothetical protein